jgi:hypothetical protein
MVLKKSFSGIGLLFEAPRKTAKHCVYIVITGKALPRNHVNSPGLCKAYMCVLQQQFLIKCINLQFATASNPNLNFQLFFSFVYLFSLFASGLIYP